ncbi:hypothetical protein [Synechococcus elongatus]|uniref:hypothetical protein n=1 Tax=Synechococcus elongatus TaxID=32046 RepID=UPI000F7DF4A0|nr:hypothetical protein [Synechococcus elongatus]
MSFADLMDEFALYGVPEEYKAQVRAELRRKRAQRAAGGSNAFLTPNGGRPEPYRTPELGNNQPNLAQLGDQVLNLQDRAQDIAQQNEREDLSLIKDASAFGRENKTLYNEQVNIRNAWEASNIYKSELPLQVAAQKELMAAQGQMYSDVISQLKPDMGVWLNILDRVDAAKAKLFSR